MADPTAELPGFSSPGAIATPWPQARDLLAAAELFWVVTVRPDGRPHVTPLLAIWLDDAGYFCTGGDEQKAKNLQTNQHCILMTGRNDLDVGTDIVVEGRAQQVTTPEELGRVADTFEERYGPRLLDPEGTWHGMGDAIRRADGVVVFRVVPDKALGFGKGPVFSQTRWTFDRA